MSETTPDPADVHTGTDRVELTKDERLKIGAEVAGFLAGTRIVGPDLAMQSVTPGLARAVESIVAARVQALAAERPECRRAVCGYFDDLQGARAELAAANARCAELEAMDAEWQRRVATLNSHGERAELISERNRATRERDEARSEAQRQEAQKTELQATLDRVTAVLASVEAINDGGWQPMVENILTKIGTDLRAALTPEGKREGCGVCLTCDPPQDDPRFGFPIMQRMYVCGTCGNKRCPASGDCLKWECSGSNATNQVPVPRTPEEKP